MMDRVKIIKRLVGEFHGVPEHGVPPAFWRILGEGERTFVLERVRKMRRF